MFKQITIDSGDAAGADLAAADWLRAADARSEPPRAAWIGSAPALQTLGLDRDTAVSRDRLASAIEGRNVRDERSVRAEGTNAAHEILVTDLRLPQSVSELALGQQPERRAALDRALFASAEASLDEIRRTIPLVERHLPDGTVVHEPARGVAAVAIVQRPPSQGQGTVPQQRVQTLIFAVEDTDGRIVVPHAPSEIGHDLASDADAAAQYTLAWELTKLGYEVDNSARGDELFQVRGGAAEIQSFQRQRAARAEMVNAMEREPETLVNHQVNATRELVWAAQEHALLLEGRAAEPGASAELLSELRTQWKSVETLTCDLDEIVEPSRIADALNGRSGTPISREDVAVPDPFQNLDAIGEQRRRRLTAHMEPLARWLEGMPNDWVAQRHARWGAPEDHVDRRAARLTRLLEMRTEVAEQELRQAMDNGSAFDARGLERKLADLREQEQQLRDDGLHLDVQTDANALTLAAAYAREHAVRREIAQQIETHERERRQAAAAHRQRGEWLEAFAIERPELPERYEQALGPKRADRLVSMVEDARLELVSPPRSREALAEQAQQLEAAGEALDLELSARVAGLEQRRLEQRRALLVANRRQADLLWLANRASKGADRDQLLAEAEGQRALAEELRQALPPDRHKLKELSTQPGHPDLWFDNHGQRFAGALAARLELEHDRTLAATTPDQAPELAGPHAQEHGPDRHELPATPDVGREPF